jgi:hypothetical protein
MTLRCGMSGEAAWRTVSGGGLRTAPLMATRPSRDQRHCHGEGGGSDAKVQFESGKFAGPPQGRRLEACPCRVRCPSPIFFPHTHGPLECFRAAVKVR